ncbi:hypothetical protein LEP1GSC018_2520 [Leptospira kirschneri str. 2008720114]|uniref:hypothetical protein n=1 Tax=Leptospira kirschneri TaxID=29507 RepID=UPI00028A07EB|nr:hypothetical protein [Leptospira kirschneri]EKP04576.1 hypothetical protein LEP1GSC018_2520 [Leptospira kirschneri str. 2008720114]EMK12536.1 hypothetical protein LEP1GSC042_0723 [Leptospira kirschneri serovar Bim str. PUO 1247]EMN03963.1 hypothetical protein LEP1GSC046_0598 [Leptospira kirschneri serovar Bim str. 1051]
MYKLFNLIYILLMKKDYLVGDEIAFQINVLHFSGTLQLLSALYSLALLNFDDWSRKIKEEFLKASDWKNEQKLVELFIQPLVLDEFPEYFYKSSFLMAYSISETAVYHYLNYLPIPMEKGAIDRKQKQIWQKLKYRLENNDSSILKNISTRINWSDLDVYRQIRNVIIHSNGILKNPSSILNYVSINQDKVYIEEKWFLHIKSSFVSTFIGEILNIHELLFRLFKDPSSAESNNNLV